MGFVVLVTLSLHDLLQRPLPSRSASYTPPTIARKHVVEDAYRVIPGHGEDESGALTADVQPAYTGNTSTQQGPDLHGGDVRPLWENKPVTHVGFLKIHKAASTTTQAIFLRFGWRRKLTFVLPPEYNRFGYPNIISLNESVTKYNTLPAPPGRPFDILCHHVVYGKKEWDSVLPADSAIIGTVREPFSLFKSTLNYFQPGPIKKIEVYDKDPIRRFLTSPSKYDSSNPRYSFLNNRLALEYGVDPSIITNRSVDGFNEYLYNVLDKQFTVVILADMFDQGLVMVKRRLNWSLNDIMYAIKNVRSVKKPDRFKVTDDLKSMYREFAIFDFLLYEFFQNKFNLQVKEEGPSFPREVTHFQETRKMVEEYCHNKKGGQTTPFKVQESEFNEAFEVSRDDCENMHKGEIMFTQEIRKEQYGAATWALGKRQP